jgi:hypothetical protein
VVVHTCNPSYAGGGVKKSEDGLGAKGQPPIYLKNKLKAKGPWLKWSSVCMRSSSTPSTSHRKRKKEGGWEGIFPSFAFAYVNMFFY